MDEISDGHGLLSRGDLVESEAGISPDHGVPPSTTVHPRWTGPMPVEWAFLPSQSAFPGLPPREEIVLVSWRLWMLGLSRHAQDRNTANLIRLAVLAAFHLPNTAIPPQ